MGGEISMSEELNKPVETNEEVAAETNTEVTTEKEKKYNDDDVNKIVNQKFAKWQEEQKQAAEKAANEAKMTAEEKAQAQHKEAQAQNAKLQSDLISKDIRIEALLKGVAPDKLDKFTKLASLSDKESPQERAEEVLAEFPEFVKADTAEQVKPPFVNHNGNSNNGGATMSKEAIMGIKDNGERQKAIKDNMHLFQN